MENLKIENLAQLSSAFFNKRIKDIKKNVGTQCSFLSNYISNDQRYIKAIVNKETFLFEIPNDITSLNKEDYARLETLIKEKCR